MDCSSAVVEEMSAGEEGDGRDQRERSESQKVWRRPANPPVWNACRKEPKMMGAVAQNL